MAELIAIDYIYPMDIINIEIKAHCRNAEQMHEALIAAEADDKGIDHQIDTYFNTTAGRLKLRKGNIEHSLIFYQRPEVKDLKRSDVILDKLERDSTVLKQQLEAAMGIKTIVDKKRHIYFIDNVKFHLDEVAGLGSFVEIEAIGKLGEEDALGKQCQHYMEFLEIHPSDLIDQSYSDMILNKT
jgi:predicted adenylyl cyclase CyaB